MSSLYGHWRGYSIEGINSLRMHIMHTHAYKVILHAAHMCTVVAREIRLDVRGKPKL